MRKKPKEGREQEEIPHPEYKIRDLLVQALVVLPSQTPQVPYQPGFEKVIMLIPLLDVIMVLPLLFTLILLIHLNLASACNLMIVFKVLFVLPITTLFMMSNRSFLVHFKMVCKSLSRLFLGRLLH
jgi:hypothetical protein